MTDKTITFSVFSVFSLSAHSPILHKISLDWRFLTKIGLLYATEYDQHNQHHRATLTAYLNTKIANSGTYANFLAINQPTTRYLSKAVKSVQNNSNLPPNLVVSPPKVDDDSGAEGDDQEEVDTGASDEGEEDDWETPGDITPPTSPDGDGTRMLLQPGHLSGGSPVPLPRK